MIAHHSGDIGDVIYCIPALNASGIDTILLDPRPIDRTKMGIAEISVLRPLLEKLGFKVQVSEGEYDIHTETNALKPLLERLGFKGTDSEEGYDVNVDGFRYCQDILTTHLALAQAKHIGVNINLAERYISVPPKRVASVVIHRSQRYHNDHLCWSTLLSKTSDVVFVGLEGEHADFCAQFRLSVPFYKVSDLLEMAQIIAAADVFIGNQSAPFAIAEGLKVNRIQETYRPSPNAIPQSANGIAIIRSQHMLKAIQLLEELL